MIRYFLLFLFLSLISIISKSYGQGIKKIYDYIDKYNRLAIFEMNRTGVPASITLAQGILESSFGESELAKSSNNHFGIKCKSNWAGEKIYFDDDESQECFRKYSSVEESFIDHSNFLKQNPRYSFLFKLDPLDDSAWAYGLKQANYATLPEYPQRLLNLILTYNLHQYSVKGLSYINNKDINFTSALTKTDSSKISISKDSVNQAKAQEDGIEYYIDKKSKHKIFIHKIIEEEKNIDKNQLHNHDHSHWTNADENKLFYKIIKINGKKAACMPKGTSILAISENFKISLAKIYSYNELDINLDFLEENQLIYIEPKAKKGRFKAIKITENESAYNIAQEEGIKLKKLLKYNKVPRNWVFSKNSIVILR